MNNSQLYNTLINSIGKEVKSALDQYSEQRGEYTFESALSNVISLNMLNKEYHVLNTFNDCIQDIISNLSNYKVDVPTYSGWCFNQLNKKCFKTKCMSDLPIFIKLINDPHYINVMSTTDRSASPSKIMITINLDKLNSIKSHKAVLSHEFRHALEMYVDKKQSHIGDSLNEIPIQQNPHYFDVAVRILNLFAPSEERARIDGAIHMLKEDLSELPISSHDKIAVLVDYTKKRHLLYEMQIYLNELKQRHRIGLYELPILVGYLWNNYIDDKIDADILEQDIFDDSNEDMSYKIISYLEDNYNIFYQRLIDCICTHILIK